MNKRKKLTPAELEKAKLDMIRTEGKTPEQVKRELAATRVLQADETGWPPKPTDGVDDSE